MCGRDHPHIGRDGRVAADAIELPIGQHAQQARLQVRWHVADFIQKQCATVSLFEAATAHGRGTGERPPFVPKQLALQQVLRNRGGVNRNERLGGARAVTVQRARHQFLAGARFAVDEHRRMRLGKTADGAKHLLHTRCGAENFRCVGGNFFFRDFAQRFVQRTANQLHGVIDIKRLGQVFERASLERRYRAFQI